MDHKLVQVNAAQRTSGSTSQFAVDFLTRDLDKVTKVVLVKASLPRLYPNIWSVNNTIVINHAGANFTLAIPQGQYDVNSMATILTATCTGINMSFAYNTVTNRFTATYTGPTTATLVSSLSTLAPFIGLTADLTLGTAADFVSPPQLSGPDEVFIHSQLTASNSCVTGTAQCCIPLIGYIPFNKVPYGFVGLYKNNSLDVMHVEFPFEQCMRKIDVKLCDSQGNILPLPDNCFLDMILQFQINP